MDLRESPGDFFTRDLDEALLRGEIDLAVHSAKDMPDPMPVGLEWVWLPWIEDSRDVLVLGRGRRVETLVKPRVAVSSERRAAWSLARWPDARLLPVRGTIEERLAQLDAGTFDVMIMAAAALIRLGLEDRITEWIPESGLPTPAGQGALGMAFRVGDPVWTRVRSLFIKPVVFVGAGAGMAGACTVDGVEALRSCEVCIHDALLDPALLDLLPPGAERIEAGKRGGAAQSPQERITEMILRYARRGRRVVRLKGGDPGVFGRLAEEAEALEAAGLPFRILPGVSSLNAATTGTGILLTRREVSSGFCAMTARAASGKVADVSMSARGKLTVVYFMGAGVAGSLMAAMMKDGQPADKPAVAVFGAGTDEEMVIRATVGTLAEQIGVSGLMRSADAGSGVDAIPDQPALIICGEAAGHRLQGNHGALHGMRILLTASEGLGLRGAQAVRDFGGIPIRRPMIRVAQSEGPHEWLGRLGDVEWMVITSPAAVDCLMDVLRGAGMDVRCLPRIVAAGSGTAMQLEKYGLRAALVPESDYGACGILECARKHVAAGARVLRVRSDRAGAGLSEALRGIGLVVEDEVMYRNEPVRYERLPLFDAVLFVSGSAVEAYVSVCGVSSLTGKIVAAFPGSAVTALGKAGVVVDIEAGESRMETCVQSLALHEVRRSVEESG
jgi:uroporphyrinogen III methyltransferase/synthase